MGGVVVNWTEVGGEDPIEIGQSGQLRVQGVLLVALQLEPLTATQQRPVLEHGDGFWVEGPVGALARPVGTPRDLDEAVVKGEVVAEAVLPALRVLPIVGEAVHDELVDVAERQHLLRRPHQGHGCQRDVGVGRLAVPVRLPTGARHGGVRENQDLGKLSQTSYNFDISLELPTFV